MQFAYIFFIAYFYKVKVRVIKWKNVLDHCSKNHEMLKAFQKFYIRLKYTNWTKPQDITQTFNHADLITCQGHSYSRIVFNVGSNKYRLVCGYTFTDNQVILYVKFVGTHKECDQIDICRVDMFKSKQ